MAESQVGGARMGVHEPAYCAVCGKLAADGVPPTWSMQHSERGLQMLCDDCTRDNIRSIEGRLDEAWW